MKSAAAPDVVDAEYRTDGLFKKLGRRPGPRRRAMGKAVSALIVLGGLAGLTGLSGLVGCAAPPRVQLNQPFAPPSQQSMLLSPASAATSAQDGHRSVLVGFTLPGATSGIRAYSLYLTFDDAAGTKLVGESAEDAARGFFMQEVGQLKGKSVCSAGEVRFAPAGFLQPDDQLEIDVRCEDGTYLSGAVPLRADPAAVRAFERRYAGDLVGLRKAASQPTGEDEQTETTSPRAGARPAR